MYYRGKMFGFVHLYNSQEAINTGVIGAMKTWLVCSTCRDHVHAVSAGVPSFEVMSNYSETTEAVKASNHIIPKEHHLLGGYTFIGEDIPVALGSAFQV